ncbi:MAG TPA: prenyltransferase/squalene oxidase repeat-containing protein [Planctomycetota bacterium]|jgi:squalene-hopene/tetraprenyl-beta-curcumene cyclase|nr:prenyltransferase/squalene oxidase repeat-containing protein [Planctomycetota bacterium]
MTKSVTLALALALVPLQRAWPQDAAPASEQVRQAVDRSLPYLEKEGIAWIQKRNCLSCHQVPFMLWSFAEAQAKGLGVPPKKLAEWTDWSMNESLAQQTRLKLTDRDLETLKAGGIPAETLSKLLPLTKKSAAKEADFVKELSKTLSPEEWAQNQGALLQHISSEKGDGGGLDTMSQLLLAGAYGSKGNREAAFIRSTRARIAELQQADGSWKPGGQLGRMGRSEQEGAQVTTLWTVLALSGKSDAPFVANVERALAFLKNGKPGKTNEWLAARLLVEKELGSPEASGTLLKELLDRQNPDGGWAWVPGAPSIAFATGQVLYAVSRSGVSGDDPAVQRARKFLVETQGEDGSWTVPPAHLTSPNTTPDRLKRLEPIYRFWGSAWATIGLAKSLPDKP